MKQHRDNNGPPRWARTLLSWFCPSNVLEEVDGDLLEEYDYQFKLFGERKANWDYVISVIAFIHPFAPRKRSDHVTPFISSIMWKNYLITSLRNISRNRTYSMINLAGLTLGLACSMVIFQNVLFEKSADSFHRNADNIYRIAFRAVNSGGSPETIAQIFLGAAPAFKDAIPSIDSYTRIRADFFQEGPTISYTAGTEKIAFKDIRSIIVDTTFLEMFSFPLIKGDAASVLRLPNSIVITESMASRLFGSEDPIGKNVEYGLTQGTLNLEVKGVIQDTPSNSHIQFDVIIPMDGFMSNVPKGARYYSDWNFREFTTYAELEASANIEEVERLMTEVVNQNIGESLKQTNTTVTAHLQPLRSLYFDRETDLGLTGFGSALVSTRTGDKQMNYFFTVIAIITLAIALMSYINLSTVRSLDRAKEVGIRKVIGAYKHNLRSQFFMESALINFAALFFAAGLVAVLMPTFNSVVGTSFTWASWFNRPFMMLFGAVFVCGVLLSGLYPAFILSSFMPIVALKGKVGSFGSRSKLRKILVVFQYAPAIVLLVCTVVVYTQLNFMRNMNVGLKMDELITIRSPRFLPEGMRSRDAEAVFKNEMANLNGVAATSYTGNQAGRGLNFLITFSIDSVGEPGAQQLKGSGVDHDFAEVFGLKLLAGESFTEGMVPNYGDPEEFVRKVMINETAARALGFKRYGDAIARVVSSVEGGKFYIQAVLADFNWGSVHKATDPVMFWYTPANRFMTIKFSRDADFENVLSRVKAAYNRLFPLDVFHYEFAEDVYKRQYGEDEKFANLFVIFSGMAILIASMGLFGLSAFSAERRSKEVGIRKVMGATSSHIVQLLSREFFLLVFIAFVFASPIAWLVMHTWLQNFAFHITLTAMPFMLTGSGALFIAALTISWKSLRAANTNPVNVLRNE